MHNFHIICITIKVKCQKIEVLCYHFYSSYQKDMLIKISKWYRNPWKKNSRADLLHNVQPCVLRNNSILLFLFCIETLLHTFTPRPFQWVAESRVHFQITQWFPHLKRKQCIFLLATLEHYTSNFNKLNWTKSLSPLKFKCSKSLSLHYKAGWDLHVPLKHFIRVIKIISPAVWS